MKKHLEAAEAVMKSTAARGRDWPKYVERMKFTRHSFDVVDGYMSMIRHAASEADYQAAAAAGDKALAARAELTKMNDTFTTLLMGESGAAWFPGEVDQYRELHRLTDGTKGTLVAKLPLEWAFHRDPNDTGLVRGYAYHPVDLTYWNEHGKSLTREQRKDYPTTQWEKLNVDVYAQAQGILHPDWQSFTGHMWYRTDVKLDAAQTQGKTHLMFPGLFNEAWLYVNGSMVAYRSFPNIWWLSDYTFTWDVDLTGLLKPGENNITVRLNNEHHFGGMFRRPFIYQAK